MRFRYFRAWLGVHETPSHICDADTASAVVVKQGLINVGVQ